MKQGKECLLTFLRKKTLSDAIGILHYIAIISMGLLFTYSLFAWLSTSNVWGFGDIFGVLG
jgi:hypothetical protein